MSEEMAKMRDCFISYNRADKTWAEWIGWTLEEAGYSVVIDAWDFRPGGNFALEMDKAVKESQKTIAILSESYLKAVFVHPEWAAAFAGDPLGVERKLIPVKVKECEPDGLLKQLIYVDLIGLTEVEARQSLLDMLRDRLKPEHKPRFPGQEGHLESVSRGRIIPEPKAFPKALSQTQKLNESILQERLASLSKEAGIANAQWKTTFDEIGRSRLQVRMNGLIDQMNQIEDELNRLDK
jgi:TIR domain/Effector-associated domain 9